MTENESYSAFCATILKALHIDSAHFQEKVDLKEPYETQINHWIKEQYASNYGTDQAIRNIYVYLRAMLHQVECFDT